MCFRKDLYFTLIKKIMNPLIISSFIEFVVELCEPVQVRNLEIANLELFSSLPESFIAHISDR